MPANFWVANPDVTNANVVTNGHDTHYNSIQLLLNRRFANGFSVQSNYTYGRGYQQQFYSFHKPYRSEERRVGKEATSCRPTKRTDGATSSSSTRSTSRTDRKS